MDKDNFIDLSHIINSLPPSDEPLEGLLGPSKTFKITGTWDTRLRCAICGEPIDTGPEGVPIIRHKVYGVVGPGCVKCVEKIPVREDGDD